jgi:hypothetical protein
MEYYFDVETLESSSRGQRRRHRSITRHARGVASTPPMNRAKTMANGVDKSFHTMFPTKLKVGVHVLEQIALENLKWV